MAFHLNGNPELLLPIILPLLGAAACRAAQRRSSGARDTMAAFVCLLVLVAVCGLTRSLLVSQAVFGADLSLELGAVFAHGISFKLDGFRAVFCVVSAAAWLCACLYSRSHGPENDSRFCLFSMLTLSACMGVFLSNDLFTTFIFFELASLCPYAWVACDETPSAMRAGGTYIYVSVIGGMVMLMGLFLLQNKLGALCFDELYAAGAALTDRGGLYLACALLFAGFGAKAGAWPLHFWMQDSYSSAPPAGTALLSAIVSKCGVFGILVIGGTIMYADAQWGMAMLIIGLVTMAFGAVLALLSDDLMRTLACSSMSQIGFILVGAAMSVLLGEHAATAASGAVLHMLNHSLVKLVLFLAAGLLCKQAGSTCLNHLRGIGHGRPLIMVVFLVGALAVGGVPLFSGYVSKTLIHEGIVEYIALGGGALFSAIEWLFLLSGGLTVAYMLKLFVTLFVEKPPASQSVKRIGLPTAAALTVPAIALLVLGFAPSLTALPLAEAMSGILGDVGYMHEPELFSLSALSGSLISLAFGALVYLLFVRRVMLRNTGEGREYRALLPGKAGLERLILRPLVTETIPRALGAVGLFFDSIVIKPAPLLYRLMGMLGIFFDRMIIEPLGHLVTTVGIAAAGLADKYAMGGPAHGILSIFRFGASRAEGASGRPSRRAGHRYVVSRSLSYGLLAVSVGICAILLYVLIRALI